METLTFAAEEMKDEPDMPELMPVAEMPVRLPYNQ
jgi:hypothetical protein